MYVRTSLDCSPPLLIDCQDRRFSIPFFGGLKFQFFDRNTFFFSFFMRIVLFRCISPPSVLPPFLLLVEQCLSSAAKFPFYFGPQVSRNSVSRQMGSVPMRVRDGQLPPQLFLRETWSSL